MNFLHRGLVIGFSIAAPVGPIGLLCLRRTVLQGRAAGFVCGLGAATADAMYGAVAGFGLTTVTALLTGEQKWLQLIGGIFLLYLGGKTFFSPAPPATTLAERADLRAIYVSTLLLTLANPATILSFGAVFAGLGLGGRAADFRAATWLVTGVFAGSAAWWLLLSSGVAWFRHQLDPARLRWLNWLSGATIAAFGLVALLRLPW